MGRMPHSELLNACLSGDYDRDTKALRTVMNIPENADAILREFMGAGLKMCCLFVDGMANSDRISDFCMRCAMTGQRAPADASPEAISAFVQEHLLEVPQIETETRVKQILRQVLSGMTLFLAEGMTEGILLETRGFDKRGVTRTNGESVVVGAQEGFVESLRTNITLVRRYCQSQQLITEFMSAGTGVSSKIALMYLKGVADERALSEVRRRVAALDVPDVRGTGQLQQFIEDRPLSLLPQMLETERPDRTVSCLLDGQFALIMEGSPYALCAPVTLFHLLHASDDHFMRWQYGTFLRLIRMLGILLSLTLPGVYVALTLFHPHLIPMALLTSIAESRANVPFPVLTEVLVMEFSFYLINEAGTRIPAQIGSALGIVGALILGQAAVAANIISPILIIVVALTGLGNYVIPNYGLSIGVVIYRLIVVFAGALGGVYGIVLALFAILCQLCGIHSFGVPYMAPVAPYRPHNPDILTRMPMRTQRKRMFYAQRNSWLWGGEEDGT